MTRPYKVICISIYESDLALADAKVDEFKRRGVNMNRSMLIRLALSRLDVDAVRVPELELKAAPPTFAGEF